MNDHPERTNKPFPVIKAGIVAVLVITCAWFGPRFVREAREAETRSAIKRNLRQVKLALQNNHDRHPAVPAGTSAGAAGAVRESGSESSRSSVPNGDEGAVVPE